MAAGGRNWRGLATVALLWLGSVVVLCAQAAPETGAMAGRLTDLHSRPLAGATLVLRNLKTGAEQRTTTARNGSYQFLGLAPGEYILRAESATLGQGQLEDILIDAGHTARVQAAMDLQPAPSRPAAPLVASAAPAKPPEPVPNVQAERTSPPPVRLEAPVAAPPASPQPAGLAAPQPAPPAPTPAPLPVTLAQIEPVPFAVLPLTRRTTDGLNAASVTAALDRVAALRARSQLVVERIEPSPLPELTGEQLEALPVSGQRWQEFALDASGEAVTDASHSRSFMRAGMRQGMREGQGGQSELTVDGAPAGTAFGPGGGRGRQGAEGADGEPIAMGRAWSGAESFALSEPAVGRLRIGSGGPGSSAARSGGQLEVETRKGANGFHGQGFAFGRQNVWGARNPFSQWVKETAPASNYATPVFTAEPYTPDESEVSWGIGVGRHIRRDRLFWFAALDHLSRDNPGMATVKHPDLFFAQPSNDEAQVLAQRLALVVHDPIAAGLAAYGQMLETLAGLLGPSPRAAAQWTGFGRVDWELAERHRLTVETAAARWDSPGGGLQRTSEAYGNHSFGSSRASQWWALGRWEAFLTPNLLAVTQGSAGRTIQLATPETPSAWEQTLLKGNAWGRLPQISVDPAYGFTLGNPARFGDGAYPDEHRYTVQQRLDWVRGPLLVRAGAELDRAADAVGLLRNQTGTYHYARVENFVSDALVYAKYGIANQLNPFDQHNCDVQGKAWREPDRVLRGLSYLPCYSYYTQTMGPSDWHLSSNHWAGYVSAQWQPAKWMVASAGLRWERQQLAPPIGALANPELPLAGRMPSPGNDWGPRFGLAVGTGEGHWPVLRLGAGEYFAPPRNLTLLRPLTETGSLKGDLRFFMRPTDNLNQGGAPPFPYVLSGEPVSVVKPGAAQFAPGFRNGEIQQYMAGIEEKLPWHLHLDASAALSLGRRLPISVDANLDPAVNPGTITYQVVDPTGKGPIKASTITVPFYATWPSATSPTGFAGRMNPDYQQVTQVAGRANSTYEAAMIRLERFSRRGLGFRLHYIYGHAMDWNPNETGQVSGSDLLDPADLCQEYGTGDLDLRHSVSAFLILEAPWKLHGLSGRLANGWRLSGTGQYRSGMPYTMRTSGQIPHEFLFSSGQFAVGLGPGMNGSGGDNRVYGVGRNTFRYPGTWKADLRLARTFNLGQMRELELLAESFNLFNHRNVTELETVGYTIGGGALANSSPTLTFLSGQKANTTAFGQPLNANATNFFRERQIQFGLRVRF